MGYDRKLAATRDESQQETLDQPAGDAETPLRPNPSSERWTRKRRLLLLTAFSLMLVIASAISVTLVMRLRRSASGGSGTRRPTKAISSACSHTLYPALCVESLLDFPGSTAAGTTEQDLVRISFNMTHHRFTKAFYLSSSISYIEMDPLTKSAYDDCVELLEDSVHALSRALSSVSPSEGGGSGEGAAGSTEDVMTWLSTAMTNHDTCSEGFKGVDAGPVKDRISEKLKDLSELVSNCLAIFSAIGNGEVGDFSGVPIQNRRRRLMDIEEEDEWLNGDEGFPWWVGKTERKLLAVPAAEIQADIVVSKDGENGTFKTISEAIKKAPEHSDRRIVIYIRAGR
ncbi:hypothetical protein SAY86_017711 [Trapa natans]|uniref:pectinesterase n=1 Tax=Trapa natans TaxID=22666 RepID=A0AAN7LQS7_TRANT|nr:hypothetical protein SAY86_017711 [Trapa natans]